MTLTARGRQKLVKKMADAKSFVVKNAVGEYIREKELKVSSELFDDDGLNAIIKALLDKACDRAKANNRKTVMKQDL